MSSSWWFGAAVVLYVLGCLAWSVLIPPAVIAFFVGWYRYGVERTR